MKTRCTQKLIAAFSDLLTVLFFAASTNVSAQTPASAAEQIYSNMLERRAVEATMWAMPLINFQAMRDGMARDNGAGPNAISYFSRPQDWRLQITTPNNNTLYVMSF